VLRQKAHRLSHIRPPAPADQPLEGGHQADADILRGGQALEQMHRPHQVYGDYSLIRLEDTGKMGDGTAQWPVAEDVALLELCRRIEGMQILPAGGLSRQRRQGEIGPKAVQDAHYLLSPIRAGQEPGDLLRPAGKPLLLQHGAALQAGHVHQLSRKLPAAGETTLPAVVARQELFYVLHPLFPAVLHEAV